MMKKENNLSIAEYLEKIAGTNLEVDVIRSLKDEIGETGTLDDWISFLNDIVTDGLESGIVKTMINTMDVQEFALDNFEDITELIEDLKLDVKVGYNLLEKLAYIGYECVCSKMLAILEAAEEEDEHSEKKGEVIMMKKENNLNVADYLEEKFGYRDLEFAVIENLDDEMDETSTLDEWISFVSDVVNYGLEGGSVGSMIYTEDIEKFASDNLDALIDFIDCLGIEVKVEHGYLTKLAYIGYECVCSEILDVLEDLKDEIEIECLA